jgi:hypothetical protein
MKKILASMIIVIFLALVVSQAVPASANFAKPSKSTSPPTEGREYQLIGVNFNPINVKTKGFINATGWLQVYCPSCYPPGWQPAADVEIHLDQVSNGNWNIFANGTTDSNGYFQLICPAPSTPGIYQYGVLVPSRGGNNGVSIGPYIITVYASNFLTNARFPPVDRT